jgi:hypothetical protein
MQNKQQPTPKSKIPSAFWFYLVALHVVYAFVLTQHMAWLRDARLALPGFAFAEWAALFDLVIVPSLLYAVLARKNKLQMLLGALSMAGLGSLALNCWFPTREMVASLSTLLQLRQHLSPFLWLLLGAFELYVIVMFVQHLRKPMKEGAVAIMLAPLISALGRNHSVVRWLSAEQRMWIYGLTIRLPKPEDFVGDVHFCYAQQNGNASTWLGFFIANSAPIPVLHVVLAMFSSRLAWVVSVLTALSSFWLWAEYRATLARPISLDQDTLYLRYGLSCDLRLPLVEIRSAKLLNWRDLSDQMQVGTAGSRSVRAKVLQGMGAANIELRMQDGQYYRIGVDTPDAFVRLLQSKCGRQIIG